MESSVTRLNGENILFTTESGLRKRLGCVEVSLLLQIDAFWRDLSNGI